MSLNLGFINFGIMKTPNQYIRILLLFGVLLLFGNCGGSKGSCSDQEIIDTLVKTVEKDISFIYAFTTLRCYFPPGNILQPNTTQETDEFISKFEVIFERLKPFNISSKNVKNQYIKLLDSFKEIRDYNQKLETWERLPESSSKEKSVALLEGKKANHLEEFATSYPKEVQEATLTYYAELQDRIYKEIRKNCKISTSVFSTDDQERYKQEINKLWLAEKQNNPLPNNGALCINDANNTFKEVVKEMIPSYEYQIKKK